MNKLEVNCDLKELETIYKFIFDDSFFDDSKIKTIQLKLELVIEEIFTNIVKFSQNFVDKIIIQYELYFEKIIIQICDKGIPFNPLLKENVDVSLDVDSREIGGLGIFIVKEFVNKLDYKYLNNMNILTIEKSFNEELN